MEVKPDIRLEEYLAPKFNFKRIDCYYVRKSILEVIKRNSHLLNGTMLDVGCGKMPYKSILTKPNGFVSEYIGLDLIKPLEGYEAARPDIFWDGSQIPLQNESVDSILLTEVLEHCFEPILVLGECYRVLKKGGHLVVTVPFLWPLHDIPFDEYRYTPYSLRKILMQSGFTDFQIKALGGWNASLGQMMALWIKRSGISGWRREILYAVFFKRFIKWLYARDRKPDNFEDHAGMITGLEVVVRKCM